VTWALTVLSSSSMVFLFSFSDSNSKEIFESCTQRKLFTSSAFFGEICLALTGKRRCVLFARDAYFARFSMCSSDCNYAHQIGTKHRHTYMYVLNLRVCLLDLDLNLPEHVEWLLRTRQHRHPQQIGCSQTDWRIHVFKRTDDS
jgi:hypothetical protein